MNNIKVLLVDDEILLTESLEIILTMTGRMEIIGKAKDGHEALEILEKQTADIALVDLNMSNMGGLELIPIMKKQYPSTKVLVLTTFYDDKDIATAISRGADGYILKDIGREAITGAIWNVMSGQSVLDAKVLQKLSKMMLEDTASENSFLEDARFTSLTKRELEICRMIAEGYTNGQIASFLYISEGTVKNYISSIYDKTDIHDRAQLALLLKDLL